MIEAIQVFLNRWSRFDGYEGVFTSHDAAHAIVALESVDYTCISNCPICASDLLTWSALSSTKPRTGDLTATSPRCSAVIVVYKSRYGQEMSLTAWKHGCS
jgi:hypothetical protein